MHNEKVNNKEKTLTVTWQDLKWKPMIPFNSLLNGITCMDDLIIAISYVTLTFSDDDKTYTCGEYEVMFTLHQGCL